MKIKKVKSYSFAKYPSEKYEKKEYNKLLYTFLFGGNSLLVLSMLQGCFGRGVDGNEIMPDQVTEAEARDVINAVFERNSINLTTDYSMTIPLENIDSTSVETDSATVILDGYNPEQKIGYEYISYSEPDSVDDEYEFCYDPRVLQHFNQANLDGEKHVKIIDELFDEGSWEEWLDSEIQTFIDSIRANGNI